MSIKDNNKSLIVGGLVLLVVAVAVLIFWQGDLTKQLLSQSSNNNDNSLVPQTSGRDDSGALNSSEASQSADVASNSKVTKDESSSVTGDADQDDGSQPLITELKAEEDLTPLPKMAFNNADDSLSWKKEFETEQVFLESELRIKGPDGLYVVKKFEQNEAIKMKLDLKDGQYFWETRETPYLDEYALQQLRKVRESGNADNVKQMIEELRNQGLYPSERELVNNVQSGHFWVMDGVIANIAEMEQG